MPNLFRGIAERRSYPILRPVVFESGALRRDWVIFPGAVRAGSIVDQRLVRKLGR
jgi:hypothetical protein